MTGFEYRMGLAGLPMEASLRDWRESEDAVARIENRFMKWQLRISNDEGRVTKGRTSQRAVPTWKGAER